jgi:crotonobetainyl-CoA:carnitine CoA-transferase CaiB-like acyl-CoA transferase
VKIRDLKVLELASVLAGPAVGMFFSELGAKVIKVENKTTGGDVTRQWKLPKEEKETSISAYYSSVNWNKTVVMLDFRQKSDLQELLMMISECDILITNFKAGDARKFKLEYKDIKDINPGIIYAEITGFGPGHHRAAFDVVLQAETGFMSMTGFPGQKPAKMPVALIDLLAAHQLKEGILCALLENRRPARVSVSLYDAAIASLANQASNYLMTGHIPKAIGSKHPNIAPYGDSFITSDEKYMVLAVGNNKQFERLLQILKLKPQEKFRTNQARVQNREDLASYLQEAIATFERDDLLSELARNNVPAGAVLNLKEVLDQPSAQNLVLKEEKEGVKSQRLKTSIFSIRS